MSACVALAWSIFIVPLLAAAVAGRPVQANPSTVSVIQTARVTVASRPAAVKAGQPSVTWTVRPGDTLSGIAAALAVPGGWQALYAANKQAIGPNPNAIRPGTLLLLPQRPPARYRVAPGDTLSGIAAALGVSGGWQALYAANRPAIGPNPNLIRPGVVLMSPRVSPRTAPSTPARTPARVSRHPAVPGPRHQATPPASNGTLTPPAGATRPPAAAGGMPRWLEDVLLTVGVLAATAFASEPVAAITRRRRQEEHLEERQSGWRAGRRTARPAPKTASDPDPVPGATRARIVLADHERLIVTYCAQDDTVYVLTPPGEDPRAVLRAARLVVPESAYQDLASHLGVPSAWPLE